MNIKTYKVDQYKKKKIYYRNYGEMFEYLVVMGGELYTAHIKIKPSFKMKMLFLLGIKEEKYTEDQTKAIIKQLRLMAEATIDHIQKNK
ncbi:MAG: hypothetical protein K9L99_05820 [Candidatus Omnitrophica bacterium]|nr:hypothetical protein [Candidatus Omnitrophota bacterium]